jgi:predicted NBD/HSP70 family sugar kinase
MSFFGYSVYNKYKRFIMLAVGIDIGGTSIKGAVVNELGEASEMFSLPVVKSDGQERIIEKTENKKATELT